MDFVGVIADVGAFLSARGYRYAVAGGVALAAYGHPRLTLDLDIVTEADAQPVLIPFMEGLGRLSPGIAGDRSSRSARLLREGGPPGAVA